MKNTASHSVGLMRQESGSSLLFSKLLSMDHNDVAAVPASAYLCFKIATTTKPTLKLAALL